MVPVAGPALARADDEAHIAGMASKMKLEIVDGPLDAGKPSSPRYRTAIGPDGKQVRVRTLDPNSATFAADFLSSFRANVRLARAENRALGLDD